jgi:dCTP deaminase
MAGCIRKAVILSKQKPINLKKQQTMCLSDHSIISAVQNGDIRIEPFNAAKLGPNSYDFCLGDTLTIYEPGVLDPKVDNPCFVRPIPEEGLVLFPGQLYLGWTVEKMGSNRYKPFIEGNSSTGRLGIEIHISAGSGDVGFFGHWTLEITVVRAVIIYPGMPIGQILFSPVEGKVLRPYDQIATSKYNTDNKGRSSQMFKKFI